MIANLERFVQPGRDGNFLALGSGALLPIAFAPFDFFPLAVLSIALLFALIVQLSPWAAFRRGYLFGLGMFGVGVSWVYVSIHDFGYAPVPLALLLTALFVAFLALFTGFWAYVTAVLFGFFRIVTRLGLRLLLVLPITWVLFEWLRGWFLTGFPWLNLGYSQIDSPLAGLGAILGVYGVSYAVAISAAIVVYLVFKGIKLAWPWLLALAALWLAAALLKVVPWTQPYGEPLTVSLLQGNIAQDRKWSPDERMNTIQLYTHMTRERWHSDLIVWPETALPAYYHRATEYLDDLAAQARANNTDVLIGLPYRDEKTRSIHNAMVSLGQEREFYFKRHLVPFGDYLPLEEWLRGLIQFFDLPMSSFRSGPDEQAPLKLSGDNKAAVSICYEDAFGEEVIDFLPEATLLVNASNDAWWGKSIGTHQHLQIARMRSLETGRPMLRATNNGITALMDHKGQVIDRAPQFETVALTGIVQPMQGTTPYVRLGNTLIIALLSLTLLLVGFAIRAKVNTNS